MNGFQRRGGVLWAEGVSIESIVGSVGSPVFVYSASVLRERARAVFDGFGGLGAGVRYAVKANGNLSVLRLLIESGCGMDVVSGGELYRARRAGCPGHRICFAGVSKTEDELRAALGLDGSGEAVGLINVESASELRLLDRVAREGGVRARALLRVNPDVDAKTHRHTTTARPDSKFGIEAEEAVALYARREVFAGVELLGLHAHIGSPIREPARYAAAAARLAGLAQRIRAGGGTVRVLNLGGGFAHGYWGEAVEPIGAYADAVRGTIAGELARGTEVLIEPGRVIAAGAGVLVVRAVHVKDNPQRSFALCDAGMNALARPALYEAEHRVEPVSLRAGAARAIDIAGPLCESTDFLARGRALAPVEAGDLLAVLDAGAYGMSMASNYNEHRKAAEVLVDGDRWAVVRERQALEDLVRGEGEPVWRA
ncbi:MAG: diaminopimelate decarboxylase [Planctomycetota bacterium]